MNTLPVFRLPLAACPHELVPLHIFEPRYRAMLAHCRAELEQGGSGEFVVLFTNKHAAREVGCVTRLVKVLKEHDDGRLDIVVRGRRRVKVDNIQENEGGYPRGGTSLFQDERSDWDEEIANEAFNTHRALMQVMTGKQPDDSFYAGLPDLSYLLASSAGLDAAVKQALLELRNEDDRLRLVTRVMADLLVKVEMVQSSARAIQGYWELQKMFSGR
ncbi:MAG: LON peptidase substrate-binding domain-containing protein [Kiritimatiellia bacterium]